MNITLHSYCLRIKTLFLANKIYEDLTLLPYVKVNLTNWVKVKLSKPFLIKPL